MGHDSAEVKVDINNDGVLDKTLQQAINDGDFGGVRWESNWYRITADRFYQNGDSDRNGNTINFQHNLGGSVYHVTLLGTPDGSSPDLNNVFVVEPFHSDYGAGCSFIGAQVVAIDGVDFGLSVSLKGPGMTGGACFTSYTNNIGTMSRINDGYIKIILTKID